MELSTFDIVGDIHGHVAHLEKLLEKLGYEKVNGCWSHESSRVIFVGDLIDRGPNSFAVLGLVREMVDAGAAELVLGNHELNWITDASPFVNDLDSFVNATLRNPERHGLVPEYLDDLDRLVGHFHWLRTQPLFIDRPELRVVHAGWCGDFINVLKRNGVFRLDDAGLCKYMQTYSAEYFAIDFLLAGCIHEWLLPEECKSSRYLTRRTRVRWWVEPARQNNGWRTEPQLGQVWEPPVFFGHHALSANPWIVAPDTVCVDFGLGYGGPLAAYRHGPRNKIDPGNLFLTNA